MSEHVTGPRGAADGAGTAIFMRAPHRFQLNIEFASAPELSRTQVYDYDTKRMRTTRSGSTTTTTTNVEPYTLLHDATYRGTERVGGGEAYHVSGTLCQEQLCPTTDYWIRTSDLYIVRITQHVEASGITDDITYADPAFNTGTTVPAP
jgi:hypothetical protein